MDSSDPPIWLTCRPPLFSSRQPVLSSGSRSPKAVRLRDSGPLGVLHWRACALVLTHSQQVCHLIPDHPLHDPGTVNRGLRRRPVVRGDDREAQLWAGVEESLWQIVLVSACEPSRLDIDHDRRGRGTASAPRIEHDARVRAVANASLVGWSGYTGPCADSRPANSALSKATAHGLISRTPGLWSRVRND